MKKTIVLVICSLAILTGCINNSDNINKNKINNNNEVEEKDVRVNEIKVTINNNIYKLNLEKNKTVEEFINILPKEFNMKELNGNEKYIYLDKSLPTNSSDPKRINAGDVMLYGNNCLVIFYKSFDTSYQYTKIGHIENLDDIGSENITVIFKK